MDVFIYEENNRGAQVRLCLEWLARLPGHRIAKVDEYMRGADCRVCHVVVRPREVAHD